MHDAKLQHEVLRTAYQQHVQTGRGKNYLLPSVKDFDSENGQIFTCNMFTLRQCKNKLCKMEHLLTTQTENEYPEQLVNMINTGVAVAVTKPKGGKRR